MLNLQDFIEAHPGQAVSARSKPDMNRVNKILGDLGFHGARELERYLADYGWLGYKSVMFLGADGDVSDMRDATLLLRKSFPMANGYAALESLGDGVWALCDGHGRVFRFDAGTKSLSDLHAQLEAYILKRFLFEAKEQ